MSILTEYLKGKEERSKIIADYYKGEKDLEDLYYDRLGELEKSLRRLRSEKEVSLIRYKEEKDYEKNEKYKDIRWEEEKLYATLYCKYFQLKGMKSVSPLKMPKLIKKDEEEGIVYFSKLVDTDYCKLNYQHVITKKGKKSILIIGSCIIPTNRVLMLNLCGEYFHFKGMKGLDKENLPKLLHATGLSKCPINIYSMGWGLLYSNGKNGEIHRNFVMEIPYSKALNMPKFKTCQEIASIICGINEKFYMGYWFKAKEMPVKLFKELIEDNLIQRELNTIYNISAEDQMKLLEEI